MSPNLSQVIHLRRHLVLARLLSHGMMCPMGLAIRIRRRLPQYFAGHATKVLQLGSLLAVDMPTEGRVRNPSVGLDVALRSRAHVARRESTRAPIARSEFNLCEPP